MTEVTQEQQQQAEERKGNAVQEEQLVLKLKRSCAY